MVKIGNFKLRKELLVQVINHLKTAFERDVTEDEAIRFLVDNTDILSSIVGYDEVDTDDRHRIWDACDAERSK